MLVTDLVLRAKKRKQQENRNGAAVPIILPSGVGVGWVGQF